MVDAEQCLHRVTAGVINDILKARCVYFLSIRVVVCTSPQLSNSGIWAFAGLYLHSSRLTRQSQRSQARHYNALRQ
jgi:hypothetical protein